MRGNGYVDHQRESHIGGSGVQDEKGTTGYNLDWSRRPRPSPKKSSAKKVASPSSKKMFQPESEDDEDAVANSYSDDPIVPPLLPSSSANSCSHCGHQRQRGSVPVACTTCQQFFLCMKCQFNTNALAEHQKDHPELEGRRTRRRAQGPVLDV